MMRGNWPGALSDCMGEDDDDIALDEKDESEALTEVQDYLELENDDELTGDIPLTSSAPHASVNFQL
uniref:Uncharacterized protein n=1 Tax=Caenorhabditis japonica TaxID=281687 RepID=A0A8R1EDR5_CAEJA